jgi:hypothetical protein
MVKIRVAETVRVLKGRKYLVQNKRDALTILVACICRRVEDGSPCSKEVEILGDIGCYARNGLADRQMGVPSGDAPALPDLNRQIE